MLTEPHLRASLLKPMWQTTRASFLRRVFERKRLSSCLLVKADDSYRVVIALPELDPAFTDKQTLLVFLRDGKPLGEKEGPYRIVIPDEKRMAR